MNLRDHIEFWKCVLFLSLPPANPAYRAKPYKLFQFKAQI